jgi:hypothetical protein
MTNLIVKPIDPAAPGSWRQRSKLLRAATKMASEQGEEQVQGYIDLEDAALDRLATDDGTPVSDALDQLSADQFDELVEALLETPVPTQSGNSSGTTDSG